jgi:hypothetical protein
MSSTSSRSTLLLPVGAVCCAALALFLSQRFGLSASSSNGSSTLILTNNPRPTPPEVDQTLAGYEAARQQLEAGRDAQAIAQLERLRYQPLTVAPAHVGGVPTQAPSDIAAAALLVRVGTTLCARARTAAVAGDLASARAWINRTRTIAAHVLDSGGGAHAASMAAVPTMEALFTARSLDAKAARAEREMPLRDDDRQHRSGALNRAYQTVIWPEVVAAAERRKNVEAEAVSRVAQAGDGMIAQARRRVYRTLDAEDAELAAALIVRYAALRERTLLPDVDRNASRLRHAARKQPGAVGAMALRNVAAAKRANASAS